MNKQIAQDPVDSAYYQVDVSDGRACWEVVESDVNSELQHPVYFCGGLTDLQVNGYSGIDFGDARMTPEQADSICRDLACEGVTHFLATITTQSLENLEAALRNLNALADRSPLLKKMMLGIHLEGPFISPLDGPRGAHPLSFCCAPNVDVFKKLQDAAGGRIVVVTLSPEYKESPEFIRQISESTIVSIGHTAATPDQIKIAVDNGATMSTHLGNGMHKEILRHPNYLWEQIAEDRLCAGLIGDGAHLDASVLKSILRAKGTERCFLVSDSTLLAGMPPGLYENSSLGDVEITEDRRLVVPGQRTILAGAYRPLKDAMSFLLQNQISDMAGILKLMVNNPRNILLNRFGKSEWRKGFNSSFVLYGLGSDEQMNVLLTVVENEVLFSTEP